jgi:ferrous iron transport protein B
MPSAGNLEMSAPAVSPVTAESPPAGPVRVALIGNPNTGKTTLFNRLSGLRHKTSNFPGTTQEARVGVIATPDGEALVALVDLPGVYSLELEQAEAALCRAVLAGETAPRGERLAAPDAVCVVLDGTNLLRNLMLAGEALRRRLPTVVAVNMIDLARRRGLHIEAAQLAERLGCGVVLCSARTGEGLDALRGALAEARIPNHTPPGDDEGLSQWAAEVYAFAASAPGAGPAVETSRDSLTDRLDRVFIHPVGGLAAFAVVMTGLFWAIFTLAGYPMEWIDGVFGVLSGWVKAALPAGLLSDLMSDGVVAGVGATVIFLPQICLLFFLISLLEDTGYLARAAFVMDRVLRPFGLPGHAFVPLLSSHACALPGIMATRAIPDRRERLATILVAPFMTCAARLPVYVLVTMLLFPGRPGLAALAFVGCYLLGILAGVFSALLVRRTILRGPARPMALELPTYKLPSVRTALMTTYDRGMVFLRQAGTNILMICIALWWLSSFPHVDPPARVHELRAAADAAAISSAPLVDFEGQAREPADLLDEADRLEASHAQASSFAGRLGRAVEPVFRPLGYDWQLSIGIVTSFAAREVFVSTMAVVLAGDAEGDPAADEGVFERLKQAKRDDGVTPVFTAATSWSLLVYYVLAMQCLPTLAVTAREAGGARWALLQLVWMCGIAYVAGLVVYQGLRAAGIS